MDKKIIDEEQLDFADVLIKPRPSSINSRNDVDITRGYSFKWSDKAINGCGVVAANMATTGTFEMAKEFQKHKMFVALQKHYSANEVINFLQENQKVFGNNDYIFVSTGLRKDDFDKLKKIMATKLCNNICLDAPNGYIPNFVQHVTRLRMMFPNSVIMAGNVVTPEKTAELLHEGASLIKLGIGPGSVCRTRAQTGVGRPQLSTILECKDAAEMEKGMICADGGITCPGDIAKAFGAGADFVMLGGMLAGTKESQGELIMKQHPTKEAEMVETSDTLGYLTRTILQPKIETKYYKLFYGMSSKYAQDKHYGGMNDYRASEGKVVEVPYKGEVKYILQDIEGGLRSTMTYVGANKLTELPQRVTFYKVKHQLNDIFNGRERE